MAKPRNEVEVGIIPRNIKVIRNRISYDLIDELVNNVRKSLFIESACALSGITTNQLEKWLREGRDLLLRMEYGQIDEYNLSSAMAMYIDLYIDLRRVMAETEVADVHLLDVLAQSGDFRAIKFRLERSRSKRWGAVETEVHDIMDSDDTVSNEPRVVEYAAEIGDAEEFKALEESYEDYKAEQDVEFVVEALEVKEDE